MEAENDHMAANRSSSQNDVDLARTEFYISDQNFKVKGIDCIFHNMYAHSNFTTFRKWYDDCDADALLLLIANHVRQSLYSIIALNATKHMFVVTVACEKNWEDLPDGWSVYEKQGDGENEK
ncbi:hypothetical protein LIA77_04386 [Sarocladium implicatum]|nr:hypothetical protein LIA77_04386 [Sarocladium implicatum]